MQADEKASAETGALWMRYNWQYVTTSPLRITTVRKEELWLPLTKAGNFRAQILHEIPSTDPFITKIDNISTIYFTVKMQIVFQ